MRIALAVALALVPIAAAAQPVVVNDETELRAAIASATTGTTIQFGADITLTSGDLPAIMAAVTIDGAGHTLSGSNQYRGLTIADPTTVTNYAVTVQNLSITDVLAHGGNGGGGDQGGGGGAGLGGGIFVGAPAQVTLSNVNISNATAIGGSGGAGGIVGTGNGGGGGLGGDGSTAAGFVDGGGGGAGRTASGGTNGGGNPGIFTGAPPGGDGGAMLGGADGGGGGSDASGTGGGGVGGTTGGSGIGGDGGYGGGGGGGSSGGGGVGGFGGGGGAGINGVGGYGGGGGGTFFTTANAGGFGGGSGGNSPTAGGGGGAGLGGGIFVEDGGALTISGALTINGNSVTAGFGGGNGATDGLGGGAGLFIGGSGLVTFAPGAGVTQTIADEIADEAGLGGSNFLALEKSGAGTLVLSGNNTYAGDTTISAGTLSVASSANLGTGGLTIDGGTLQITASTTITQGIALGLGTVSVAPGITATLSGSLFDSALAPPGGAELTVAGGGTINLTGLANFYFGATNVVGGSAVVVSDDLSLGAPAAAVRLGNATTSGTLGITAGSFLVSSRAFTLNAGGGVIDTQGTATAFISGTISGAGALTKTGTGNLMLLATNTYAGGTVIRNGTLTAAGIDVFGSGRVQVDAPATILFSSFDQTVGSLAGDGTVSLGTANINVGTDNTNSSFAGVITGTGGLFKVGTGTLTLTGGNTYSGGTTVSGGRLVGDTTSLQGNILDNAQLEFNQNTAGTYGGVISGSGSLIKSGGGTLTLTGANTYSGGTTVNGGTLQGDTTTLQGDIVNNAAVSFNQTADGIYTGSMSGTGALVKNGGATLTLAGANTQSGGTVIQAGTVIGTATSFGGGILNNATAVFDQISDATFGGTIAGSGTLVKSGSGALTLTGTSTYSGGTLITDGTLIGSTQSLRGTITNDAQLTFAQNFDGTFTGSIGGTGALFKTGTGTAFLSGTSTYTGGTTVNGGILAGTTSSLQGNILNNAGVEFAQSGDGTFAGTMSGTGTLFKSGAGTLTLAGANSFTGGTVVTGGAIALAQDSALGAAASRVWLGDLASSGTLEFTNGAGLSSLRAFTLETGGGVFNTTGAPVTLAGEIDGSGGLTKIGAGVLELAHTNSYTGTTLVSGGTLRAGAANAFGNGGALQIEGGTVDLNGFAQSVSSLTGAGDIALGSGTLTAGVNDTSSVFGGAISGGGLLVKAGSGTLLLTGANSYSGGTQVLGGVLAGDTSSLQGDIVNDATVLFDQNAAGTYAGAMSGSGILMKSGSGLLTLTGNNTYSGGTVIAGGGIFATASGLSGPILNNGTLTFGGSSNGVFNGLIGGTGSVTKAGTGTMTMNGLQALTGTTSVTQGTLVMNGGTVGSVDVAPGATLLVNGLIGNSLNLAGSLFALPPSAFAAGSINSATPGTQAGAHLLDGSPYLTVGGDFTAIDGSRVAFDVAPGSDPTMLVGGRALLNGVHFDVTAPAIGNNRSSTFLALAALDGVTFSNSDIRVAQDHVEPLLTQTPNALYVTLLNLNVPLATGAGSAHQAVADAIDRTKFDATGDAKLVVNQLTALDDAGLQDALEQIAGELHASVLQTAILDAETMSDVVRDQLSSRELDSGNDFQWWGDTTCQRADFKGTARARGGQATVCSGAGGGDRKFSEKWTLGFGGSWTDGSMGLGNLGNGDYSAPRAFGYAGFKPKTLGVRFGGSGAKSNYKTKRQIQFQAYLPPELGGLPIDNGIDRTAQAEQSGGTSDQWGEIHDSRRIRTYSIEGLFGMRHARISRSSFLENGAISLSLDGDDETLNLTQTDVKIHFWRREGTYRPFADFSYRRELAEDGTRAAVRFDGFPSSDFIVEGINIPTSTYTVRGGMVFVMLFGQATLTYEYKGAEGQKRQTVGFRMRFK
jgi:autotransporter-associated beta strand protein